MKYEKELREKEKLEEESVEKPWIMESLIVKIINKGILNGRYYYFWNFSLYKRKGEILKIEDDFIATIKMIDFKTILKIDQEDLETVVPAIGEKGKLLFEPYRGEVVSVLSVNIDEYNVDVMLLKGENEY